MRSWEHQPEPKAHSFSLPVFSTSLRIGMEGKMPSSLAQPPSVRCDPNRSLAQPPSARCDLNRSLAQPPSVRCDLNHFLAQPPSARCDLDRFLAQPPSVRCDLNRFLAQPPSVRCDLTASRSGDRASSTFHLPPLLAQVSPSSPLPIPKLFPCKPIVSRNVTFSSSKNPCRALLISSSGNVALLDGHKECAKPTEDQFLF